MLELMHNATDMDELLHDLREAALQEAGVDESTVGHYCLGALASYVCMRNRGELSMLDPDPQPLSESEIDDLLVNVSMSKLQKLLDERRRELADWPEDL